MKIGDNIREIREKEKGLKKEEVAKSLGITTKAYSNIENNVSDITLTRLYALAEIFHVSPDYILNYHEKSSFSNYINNYQSNQGNQGIIIMCEDCSKVKDLEKELKESKHALINIQSRFKQQGT